MSNRPIKEKGQAMIIAVVLFTAIAMTVIFGATVPTARIVREANDLYQSKMSYLTAESGTEDVVFRLKTGKAVSAIEEIALNSATASTTITASGNDKQVITTGDASLFIRKIETNLTTGTGAAFFYGVQVGNGGFTLANTSSVIGNVYANGTVEGAGSNLIKGDVVSAGASGVVRDVHATSSVYAHTITNVTADKDAYFQSISGSTITGTSYPGSADQPALVMPVTDEEIEEWKSVAEAGGVISSPCPYKINDVTTIGPKKINCDLEISGSGDVTLTGNLWVKGDIDISNTSKIKLDSSLGSNSVAIIADDPLNRSTSSTVKLSNSTTYEGSGTPNTHVVIVSMNNSNEIGGGTTAVEVKNSATGALLVYAPHGLVDIQNSVQLKEVTAYRISLKNSASVVYETGLANLIFQSGPSGGFTINGWKEIE